MSLTFICKAQQADTIVLNRQDVVSLLDKAIICEKTNKVLSKQNELFVQINKNLTNENQQLKILNQSLDSPPKNDKKWLFLVLGLLAGFSIGNNL